jgi:hypothetical protein
MPTSTPKGLKRGPALADDDDPDVAAAAAFKSFRPADNPENADGEFNRRPGS